VTSLSPAGAVEAQGWAAYLDRLLRLDDRAAVRLQATGGVLGVWSGPPFDAVALRPVALAAPVELDRTVSARRLRDALGVALGDPIEVPDAVPGPSWVGLLPPRSGWTETGRTDERVVAGAVASAVVSFRAKSDALGEAERTADRLNRMAQEAWRTPVVGGVPLRAAHAASALGLLGEDGEAVGFAAGSWLRLAVGGGSVAVRDLDVPGLSLLFDR
jgi:hypothetical protein